MNPIKSLLIFSALVLPMTASATLFSYEDTSANNGGMSDSLTSLSTTYDSSSEVFTWDTTFNSTGVDGFWLVVNNGPNPKSSDVNELSIIYGDLINNKWSAFVYNGLNNSNSYNSPGIFLDSGSLTSDSTSFSLSLDASGINDWAILNPAPNNTDYTGIAFDEKVGIWFHISRGSSFSYDGSGVLTDYSYSSQGWYDKSGLDATNIPEPASIALMTLGLFGMGFTRRFKKK